MRHPIGIREAVAEGASGAEHPEPPVAIVQGEREVVVSIALGWVVHGSVRVSCTPRTLVVEADRCAGRREGSTLRCVVALPCEVSTGSARARLARGELTVRLALAGAMPS